MQGTPITRSTAELNLCLQSPVAHEHPCHIDRTAKLTKVLPQSAHTCSSPSLKSPKYDGVVAALACQSNPPFAAATPRTTRVRPPLLLAPLTAPPRTAPLRRVPMYKHRRYRLVQIRALPSPVLSSCSVRIFAPPFRLTYLLLSLLCAACAENHQRGLGRPLPILLPPHHPFPHSLYPNVARAPSSPHPSVPTPRFPTAAARLVGLLLPRVCGDAVRFESRTTHRRSPQLLAHLIPIPVPSPCSPAFPSPFPPHIAHPLIPSPHPHCIAVAVTVPRVLVYTAAPAPACTRHYVPGAGCVLAPVPGANFVRTPRCASSPGARPHIHAGADRVSAVRAAAHSRSAPSPSPSNPIPSHPVLPLSVPAPSPFPFLPIPPLPSPLHPYLYPAPPVRTLGAFGRQAQAHAHSTPASAPPHPRSPSPPNFRPASHSHSRSRLRRLPTRAQ
ncbi:hypothetical protein B0H16DRAFT_1725743 [Mycena metata]|uniref:Uncharacterized protein n=1 Tax=Mycena metata TaxID=1033252 RepID=A0AAD7N7U0_9AGAR|nr:hypothetical protein B0H16DRAFT_1725743 [Mycena metata]